MMTPVWARLVCPLCNLHVTVGMMSLAVTCACGAYYVDIPMWRGWYRSRQAYENGEEPIP